MKHYLKLMMVAAMGGAVTLGGYKLIERPQEQVPYHEASGAGQARTRLAAEGLGGLSVPDFTVAAEAATHTVVHVKSNMMVQTRSPYGSPFDEFFFGRPQQRSMEASGSGVITTPDGYIVTNNHVVQGASSVEVILDDGRSFPAQVIGNDPSTDIALLKVDANDLPYATFGNSDELRVGEWVLAVGNPFNLTSTVTAGIVSAKARNINILRDRMAIESFIQTDAAVNPGNSGGALVNARGELVGINTAIASMTGSYSGYSFAVPVEIVKKVIEDLMRHGVVQRAFLGADMIELNADAARKLGVGRTQGVYISRVSEGGSADLAGLTEGDIILELDGKELRNAAELSEYVGRHRPGDKIEAKVLRGESARNITIELRNSKGTTDAVRKQEGHNLAALGVELQELDSEELGNLNLRGGVRISAIHDGKIKQYTDIRPGFIITGMDNRPILNIEELRRTIQNKQGGGVMMEGIYPDRPGVYYYAFGL